LTISASGKKISASYDTRASENRPTLNVAWLGFNLVTDVQRGENGGSRLTHDFVVLDWKQVELRPGSDGRLQGGPLEMKPGAPAEPGAVVAWVSRDDGAILQVAGGWLAGHGGSKSFPSAKN
jgi:hypothetical protein